MIHLVAPTEHDLHEKFRTSNLRWQVSSMPERHGSDIISVTPTGLIGYQRKTLPDLSSSLLDGRLYYELAQMVSSASLATSFLVIESPLRRTVDELSFTDSTITPAQLRSIIAKFHLNGIGYLPTASLTDTFAAIQSMGRYLSSGDATTIRRPKQLSNTWGTIQSDAYALFLLQSFPGIGPKLAGDIYAHFHGVPIAWTVDAKALSAVPGIGKKKAADLIAALQLPNSEG